MKVLAFGEILWDIIDGVEYLGGAPFNFAAHSARCGNETYIISRLGSDYLGMRAFNMVKTLDVDLRLIQWDESYPTGVVDVTLAHGQPDYVIRKDAAYDYIDGMSALRDLHDASFDIFYFGSLAQRNSVSADSLKDILAGIKVKHIFFDVNLRKEGYNDTIITESLKECTIFKLNNDEVPIISQILVGETLLREDFCKCVRALYPNIKIILITAAEKGCYVFENSLEHIPGTPVIVQDAVGAGDAFSAAFMHVYGLSGNAISAAKVANQVGAFVATRTGAIPEYSPQIQSLLNLRSENLPDAAHNIL